MKRIKYCNSFIEKLILLIPFLLSLLTFVCLKRAYPLIMDLIKESGINNSDILSFVIDISIFIISCTPLLFSFFKSFPKRIKALLYRWIMYIYLFSHNKCIGMLCGKIINIFFRVKKLEIREQNSIVTKLLDLLNCVDDTQKLAFLTGSAYSGKTTTILMFLEELILNRNYATLYERLGHRIYYYDFDSTFSFEVFNNDYILSKYDNSLLIIDNLHRESEEQFIQMIDLIMSAGNKAYGILVVFRKPEEFLINQTKALNLYNSISTYCINVDCSSKAIGLIDEINTLNVCGNKIRFQSFLNSLGFTEANLRDYSVVYIHLYKIYEYYIKFLDRRVFNIFKIIQGSSTDVVMADAIITILMLSLHIGKFIKKDYYYVMKELNHGRISSMRAINILLAINFIEKGWYEINSSQYLLHEEVARTYLRYILQKSNNHNIVISVSKILFNKFRYSNILLGWNYSIFCRNVITYDKYMFDHVLNQANVKNMLATMEYCWDYVDQKTYTLYREHGVLNSIVGNEDTARKYLIQSFKLHPIPQTLLELFEVKHKYYLEFAKTVKKISEDTNPYVCLGISYWEKHINMHFGKFDFCCYSRDANLILENTQWIQNHEPYEGYHLLRRWYFDYFKIFFLSGMLNFKKINNNENAALSKIKYILTQRSANFDHYNQVYVLADYIQYVLLFRLRIEGIYPNKEELNFVGLKTEKEDYVTGRELQNYAMGLYDNSIQIMKKNGDHSFWHVINRKIDLLLQNDQCEFEEVEAMLECYMQHAFEIKCFEYVAYAHMFLLKVKLISQLIYVHKIRKNNQIEEHMKNFRKYYRKHNTFYKNIYAEIRLRIYEVFFVYQSKCLSSQEFKNMIDPIQKICEKQNYQRELVIIEWLKKKEYCLSPGEVKFLYQSYPIIIQ